MNRNYIYIKLWMWTEYPIVPSYSDFILKMSAVHTNYELKSNICNISEDIDIAGETAPGKIFTKTWCIIICYPSS